MRKLLIFGNSGSGKSTLAKAVAETEGLAHLDLDTLAWLPVVPPERALLEASRKKMDEFTAAHPGWVIEGCYTDLLEMVSTVASEIIFMNLDVSMCVQNDKNRPWEPHKYESKAAQDQNLEMLIEWIEQYPEREGVFSYRAQMHFYETFQGEKRMVTRNERNG